MLIVGNPIFYPISFRMRMYLTPMVLLLDIDGAYLDFAFMIGKNISAFSFLRSFHLFEVSYFSYYIYIV